MILAGLKASKNIKTKYLLPVLTGIFCICMMHCSPASAQCTNPAGNEATAIFNVDGQIMQYCDGTNWQPMGPPPSLLGSGLPNDSSLIGHWKFDETSGSVAVDSTGNVDGSLQGGLALPANSVTGVLNSAFDFDGTDDHVRVVSYTGVTDLNAITWSAWIYPQGWGENDEGDIFQADDIACQGHELRLLNDSGQNGLRAYFASSNDAESVNNTIKLNEWQHVAVTMDETWPFGSGERYPRLYVNGKEVAYDLARTDGTGNLNMDTDNCDLHIGAQPSGAERAFDGFIDDARMYDRALTAAEIAQCCSGSENAILTDGLVGHWKMDGDESDSSGSGNEGAFVGTGAPEYAQGRLGQGAVFNGGNRNFNVGDETEVKITGALSVSAWIRMDVDNQDADIVSKRENGAANRAYYLEADLGTTYSNIDFNVGDCSNAYSAVVNDVAPNVWHHFVGVYEPSTAVRLYMNGTLVDENTSSIPASICDVAHPLVIGDRSPLASYAAFEGVIDDVRVYNRVLSASEVSQLAGIGDGKIKYDITARVPKYFNGDYWTAMGPAASYEVPTAGLVGHWKMDETSGSTITDSHGTYDGTWSDSTGDDVAQETTAGKVDTAIEFDGADDIITLGTDAALLPDTFTVSAWINYQDDQNDSTLMGWNTAEPALLVDSNLNNDPMIYMGPSNYAFFDAPDLDDGWHHIVFTMPGNANADVSSSNVYVDGVLLDRYSPETSGAQVAKVNARIGQPFPGPQWVYTGAIDDVRLYDRVLSQEEVTALYAGTGGQLYSPGGGYCWGEGNPGVLGNDGGEDLAVPDQVFDISEFTQIAAGWNHSCGLTPDGKAWCWGDNSQGSLGDGTFTNRFTPVEVNNVTDFTQIAADGCLTCGVDSSGNGWCWGSDCGAGVGPVGGDCAVTDGSSVPLQVCTVNNFIQIDPGYGTWHACGVTDDGLAYCWGRAEYGRLGNNDTSTTDYDTPVQVNNITNFTQVGAGDDHTCGLRSNGEIWCWGQNDVDQLGNGGGPDSGVPVQAGTHSDYTQVSAGADHTCGLRSNGEIWCWGEGQHGRLGDGATADNASPNVVSNITNFASVDAGRQHTCGITTDNVAYCWGRDNKGQLGDGVVASGNQTVPSPVFGDLYFEQITAGYEHTCAISDLRVCASPDRKEGSIIYNDDGNIMQYCDGLNWRRIGR